MATDHELCPRIVDYVVFVGCTSWSGDSSVSQVPDILRRYPPEDHPDKTLPLDVVYFCQPEGCLTTRHKSTFSRPLAPFVFTLTEKDSGLVRFGVCLNFYRQLNSHANIYLDDNSESVANNNNEITNSDSNALPQNSVKRKKRNPFSLTSICFISHHPFFSKFRECLYFLKKLMEHTHNEFFIKNRKNSNHAHFWDTFFGECPCDTESLKSAIVDIETWIFKLLSLSTPIPGKTYILADTFPPESHPLIFAYPSDNRLSLVDFPVHLPLELLGVELCMKVLTCIILEQKVLIRSRNYNALTMTVLGLTALIYPLQYMFPVIPLLPTSMPDAEQLLLAPTPYLIGIPTCFLNHHKKFTLPEDVCLVDLDTTNIRFSLSLPKPPKLPEPEGSVLVNTLKDRLFEIKNILSKMSNIHASDEKKSNQTVSSKPDKEQWESNMESLDVAVRVALIRFFSSQNVLGGFEDHVRILRLYPRPVVAFCCNSFLDSRRNLCEFTELLSQTQAVEFLAEWLVSNEDKVLFRVTSGVTDSSEIGDKYKWFYSSLKEVKYSVWKPACDLFKKIPLAFDNEESPPPDLIVVTDESGTSGEESRKIVPASSHQDHVDKIIDTRTGAQPNRDRALLTVKLEDVFHPPTEFIGVEPEKRLQALNDHSKGKNSSKVETNSSKLNERPISHDDSKTTENSLSFLSQSIGQSAYNATSQLQKFLKENYLKISRLDSQKEAENAPVPPKLKDKSGSEEYKENQNATFLFELVESVILNGEIAGIMVRGKTKRLYEEEKNRIHSVKQIFQYFDSSVPESAEFMHEVAVVDKNCHYAISWLLSQMILGIEKNYNQPTAQNGLGSVFLILEIMHTFFQMKDDGQLKFSVFPSSDLFGASQKRNVVGAVGTPLVLNGEEYENIDISHAVAAGEERDELGKDMGRWENIEFADHAYLMTLSDKNYTNELNIEGSVKAGSKRQPLIPMRPLVYMAKSRFTDGYRYLRDTLVEVSPPDDGHMRTYMFETFVERRERSGLWNSMQFWEDSFYDAVVQERAILSMEQSPKEMLSRYFSMPITDKKRLEFDEDRLLGILLHNMIAFMVMMKVELADIRRKVRRLVAKSHIGLIYSQKINNLLEQLNHLNGNDIDLKPLISRTLKRYVYTVNVGEEASGQSINLVVSEDCLVLRSISGDIIDRWWFEILLNMTFSSKSKVLRIWLRENNQSQLYAFYTRRCKQLYLCVEEAMKKAAQKAKKPPLATDMGRKFEIEDVETGQKGYCIISLEGIVTEFPNSKTFISLSNIKRCYPKKDIFTIEEYDSTSRSLKRLTYRCWESDRIAPKIEQAASDFKSKKSKSKTLSHSEEISDDTLCVTDASEISELVDGPFRKAYRGKSILSTRSSNCVPKLALQNHYSYDVVPVSLTLPFDVKPAEMKPNLSAQTKSYSNILDTSVGSKLPHSITSTFTEEINIDRISKTKH